MVANGHRAAESAEGVFGVEAGLRAQEADPAALKADLRTLSGVARRALARAGSSAPQALPPRSIRQAESDCLALFSHLQKDPRHA